MRASCLVACLLSAAAYGQPGWWGGLGKGLRPAFTRKGTLPEAKRDPDQEFRILSSRKSSYKGDNVSASGNVHATFQGYEIFADSLVGNRKTQVFRLEGKSKLIGASETIEGGTVTVDFKNNSFSFEDGKARLEPERMEKRTTGDVFVRAGSGGGTQRDFSAQNGAMTTCDLDPAHYELKYDRARVLPGKRLELRGVSLKVLGHTLFKLPMLVLPLDRNAPKHLPEVGQSVDEGYYVKTRISVPLPGESYIDNRIDFMSKLGVGLGFDYNYTNSKTNGKLTGYAVSGGDRSKVFTIDHLQRLGSASLNLNGTYQQSNYLTAPTSTLWNASGILQVPRSGGTMRLSYNKNSSTSSGFSSANEVIGFGDDGRLFGAQSRFDVSYSKAVSSGFGTPTKNESVDIRYGASADFRSFSADLIYQRNIPVGQVANFYSSSDMTPMLTLKSTAQKLVSEGLAKAFPFTVEASIGELVNPSAISNPRVTRINFDLGFRRNDRVGSKVSVDWGSEFKQGLYSDDTAQYVLGHNANLNYNFARDSSLSVSYQYLRAFGYTPLTIDSSGRYDSFSFDLNYRPTKSLTLTAQTGYDIFQSSVGEVPWQFIWLRSKYNPGQWLDFGLSASYDTFSQAWSNIRLDSQVRFGRTNVTAGARYDGIRSQWAGLNVLIEGFKVGRLTTNALFDYNGYSKQFDSQHYQFIYDLHCAEAVLEIMDNQTGFRDGRTIGFYIRLKALPFGSSFGYGTRGNSLGGGSFGSGN